MAGRKRPSVPPGDTGDSDGSDYMPSSSSDEDEGDDMGSGSWSDEELRPRPKKTPAAKKRQSPAAGKKRQAPAAGQQGRRSTKQAQASPAKEVPSSPRRALIAPQAL